MRSDTRICNARVYQAWSDYWSSIQRFYAAQRACRCHFTIRPFLYQRRVCACAWLFFVMRPCWWWKFAVGSFFMAEFVHIVFVLEALPLSPRLRNELQGREIFKRREAKGLGWRWCVAPSTARRDARPSLSPRAWCHAPRGHAPSALPFSDCQLKVTWSFIHFFPHSIIYFVW